MARPRKHDLNLPRGVSFRFGAYHYRKAGRSKKLADDLPTALREYGKILEAEGAVAETSSGILQASSFPLTPWSFE